MRVALLVTLSACTGISGNPDGAEVLASVDQPGDVALVGDDLYFVGVAAGSDTSDYQLLHMRTDEGTPEVLYHGGVIETLTADASGAYWVVTVAGVTSVMAYRTGDSAAVELFRNPYGELRGSTYRNVVVDQDYVYYADQDGRVNKTPKLGGQSQTQILGITDTSAGALAISPDGVWVSNMHGAKLLPYGVEVMISGDEMPDSIAWGGGALFVGYSGSGQADGRVVRVTPQGATQEVATHLVLPSNLTAYDGSIYLTTGNQDSAIRRVPFDGGGSQALAQGRWPSGIAINDKYVYFSDWQNDLIRRVPH